MIINWRLPKFVSIKSGQDAISPKSLILIEVFSCRFEWKSWLAFKQPKWGHWVSIEYLLSLIGRHFFVSFTILWHTGLWCRFQGSYDPQVSQEWAPDLHWNLSATMPCYSDLHDTLKTTLIASLGLKNTRHLSNLGVKIISLCRYKCVFA